MKRFLVTYVHDGECREFIIEAEDGEEAVNHLTHCVEDVTFIISEL